MRVVRARPEFQVRIAGRLRGSAEGNGGHDMLARVSHDMAYPVAALPHVTRIADVIAMSLGLSALRRRTDLPRPALRNGFFPQVNGAVPCRAALADINDSGMK